MSGAAPLPDTLKADAIAPIGIIVLAPRLQTTRSLGLYETAVGNFSFVLR